MGFCNNEFLLISVSYSYYEVYTNTQRAFSGLGFTYGSDEDAAFIITWLELCGLGGIKLLNLKFMGFTMYQYQKKYMFQN